MLWFQIMVGGQLYSVCCHCNPHVNAACSLPQQANILLPSPKACMEASTCRRVWLQTAGFPSDASVKFTLAELCHLALKWPNPPSNRKEHANICLDFSKLRSGALDLQLEWGDVAIKETRDV